MNKGSIKDQSFWIIPLIKSSEWLKVLLIQHNQWHWWFPKWHKENNEIDIETAIREIREETWIIEVQIINWIKFSQEYNFFKDNLNYDKTVTYFPWYIKNCEISLQEKEVMDYKIIPLKELISLDFPKETIKMFNDIINYFRNS